MAKVKKEFDFENAISRLEAIVEELESGDVTLDKSITLFEEGTKLSAECGKVLDKAEQKIILVTKNSNGETIENQFETEE